MRTYYIEERGETPIYEFLANSMRNDIKRGRIRPGEKLPSKRAFAKHLNVSVITVENAYNQLIMEGYVIAKEKVGYFAEELGEIKNYQKQDYTPYTRLGLEEQHYFADFSANKIEVHLFPKAVWAKLMRNVLGLNDSSFLLTTPFNGIAYLRKAIADYLLEFRDIAILPDQVIIGSGVEYLYNRLMQMMAPDGVLGLEDPGNHKFAKIAAMYNVSCEYISLDEHGLNVESLRKSKVNVLQVSPANQFPTGIVMPVRRRNEILKWVYEEDNRYIIEDDYDSEIRTSGSMIPPISSNKVNDRVIYLNSFSKSMTPAMRISYMVLPKSLLKRYRETTVFYSCTVSSADQYMLAEFISKGYFEKHLNRVRKYYTDQKQLVLKEIQKTRLLENATLHDYYTGTAFLLELHTNLEREEIQERARDQGIHFNFLTDYSVVGIEEKQTIVINYASIKRERIPEAVWRLARIFS